jgi:two-component system nitrate/nitrite response regulator NarL
MGTASSREIRVIIVDDHEVVREGLRLLIKSEPGLKVVGEAGNSKEALHVAAREQPDIILLDLDLGTESGLDIISQLLATAKRARVLALTGLRDPEVHRQTILRGAMGVVQKEKSSQLLLKAIQKIHAGEIWYDRSKMGSVLADFSRGAQATETDATVINGPTLTHRESEIVALVSQGLKNKEIADKLFISHVTVRHHLTSIFAKVGVSSRLELIIYAYNQGLAKVRADQ